MLALASALSPVGAQEKREFGKRDISRGREMLSMIKSMLEENYYDPNFHGMDLKTRFKTAEERIKTAKSNGEINSIIAQVLVELNDSHTSFLPPERVGEVDYGWRMQLIGDKCYVVDVRPGSDAEAKGLRVGDEIWSIDGFEPSRENLWKIKYSYYVLRPRPGVRLILQNPDGTQRELDVLSKITVGKEARTARLLEEVEGQVMHAFRYHEIGSDVLIWKMPSFSVEEKEVDEALKKARDFKSLIIDLRGNGGGYEKTMLRLIGYFFDRDVKLGDIKRRKETKPLVAKTRGAERVFKGQLVVLIDSRSASAAELFSRVVQLEKRGTVIGDRSSGAVMRSMLHGDAVVRGVIGEEDISVSVAPFAVSITDADIIMLDGKSLEHTGVAPDEVLLPTGEDLSARRDPALTRAVALVGGKMSPPEAGRLFPIIHFETMKEAKEMKKQEKEKKEQERKDARKVEQN
jgi:carboxyl-terminal processing protease